VSLFVTCVSLLECLFLSVSFCVSLFVCLFLWHVYVFLCVSFCVSLFVCLFLCISFWVSLFVRLFLCVSFWVSLVVTYMSFFWHTAHGEDQTNNIWISKLTWGFRVAVWVTGTPFTSVKLCFEFWGLLWKLVWMLRGLQWKTVRNFGSRNYLKSHLLHSWYRSLVTYSCGHKRPNMSLLEYSYVSCLFWNIHMTLSEYTYEYVTRDHTCLWHIRIGLLWHIHGAAAPSNVPLHMFSCLVGMYVFFGIFICLFRSIHTCLLEHFMWYRSVVTYPAGHMWSLVTYSYVYSERVIWIFQKRHETYEYSKRDMFVTYEVPPPPPVV